MHLFTDLFHNEIFLTLWNNCNVNTLGFYICNFPYRLSSLSCQYFQNLIEFDISEFTKYFQNLIEFDISEFTTVCLRSVRFRIPNLWMKYANIDHVTCSGTNINVG